MMTDRTTPTFRVLSVCSGIGAAELAWSRLGWKIVASAEIDKFANAVRERRFPHVPNWRDVTNFERWPDAKINVLVGGTPCQSFSVAGLRAGLADPRGNLALVYLAIACRYRPDWLVWENVPGILSSGRGRDFGAFLGALAKLGYGFAYRVLDAQYFNLAQRRERVFVVGHLGGWASAGAVLFERESLCRDSPPRRKAWEETSGITTFGINRDCFDRSGEGSDRTAGKRSGLGITPDVSLSLRAKRPNAVAYGGNNTSGQIDVATAINAHGGSHGRLDFETETFVAFSCKDHAADAGIVAPTLRSMGHNKSHANAGGQVAVWCFDATQITSPANRRNSKPGGPCHTLASAAHPPALVNKNVVRRLTPPECERLQGFPDGWTAVEYRGKPAADGPRYRALGNSMAVPVMEWIGRRIERVERDIKTLGNGDVVSTVGRRGE